MRTYTITAIPAFSDNYLWLLDNGQQAAAVDPGDAAPVLATLRQNRLQLGTILVTHHHPDHTGGIDVLKRETGAAVIGPPSARIPQVEQPVRSGTRIAVLGLSFTVLEVPGHTLDHIAYFCDNEALGAPALFCGDTLFAGGCGRLFEGDAALMRRSLDTLRQLPPATRIFCAHEYTQANLKFASAVEPANAALKHRVAAVADLRRAHQPSVPSRLQDELETNPFLRWDTDTVRQAALAREQSSALSDDDVFASIRRWKDNF
jgi:hydroxyacylglutathione hydrolase